MPKRVPLQTIVVQRDGKQVVPDIGQPFDFEDDEISQIESMNPAALGTVAAVDVTKDPAPAKSGKPGTKGSKSDGDI